MILFLFAGWLTARYILAVLGGISLAIINGLKVNLSVAIVFMVNDTKQDPNITDMPSSCPRNDQEGTKGKVR
jgi:hypothetical protein